MNKSEVKEQWELRKLKELCSKITDGTPHHSKVFR